MLWNKIFIKQHNFDFILMILNFERLILPTPSNIPLICSLVSTTKNKDLRTPAHAHDPTHYKNIHSLIILRYTSII